MGELISSRDGDDAYALFLDVAQVDDYPQQVVLLDRSQSPPLPITRQLLEEVGPTQKQLEAYRLRSTGMTVAAVATALGLSHGAARTRIVVMESRIRNLLRAEGFIDDGVLVPAHRVGFEINRRMDRIVSRYGVGTA